MDTHPKKSKTLSDRLRLVVDCLPSPLAYVDHEQRFVLCNAEHVNWFGLSPEQIQGVKLPEVYDKRALRIIKPLLDEALHGKQVHAEVQLNHRNKGSRICSLKITPQLRDDGTLDGCCILATDITDMKKAKRDEEIQSQALKKASQREERVRRELEQLAWACSHDLREPLRMIRVYINLLDKRYADGFDDKENTYFRNIVGAAEKLQLMVDSLLDYARLGRSDSIKTEVNMEAVLHQACQNLTPLIQRNKARITTSTLPEVPGYPAHLLLLVQNLLSNSIQYRRKKIPEVRIEAQSGDGEYLFSLADNGIGIDPRHGDKIFDLFQRIQPPEDLAGTGIGLSLCKKIIENHDGRLWYESEAGKGTTFYFTLPK